MRHNSCCYCNKTSLIKSIVLTIYILFSLILGFVFINTSVCGIYNDKLNNTTNNIINNDCVNNTFYIVGYLFLMSIPIVIWLFVILYYISIGANNISLMLIFVVMCPLTIISGISSIAFSGCNAYCSNNIIFMTGLIFVVSGLILMLLFGCIITYNHFND